MMTDTLFEEDIMKKNQKNIIIILISLCFLVSCGISNEEKSKKWYEETKAEILRQANLKADSTTIVFNDIDSTFRKEYSFSGGQLFQEKYYSQDNLCCEIYYSKNGKFELRREFYPNEKHCGFEGIFYKKKGYGIYSCWHRNGQLKEQGVRYKGERISVWEEWDETGRLISTIEYIGTSNLLDSMPQITRD